MLGVLGAEFGAEMEPSRRKPAAADGAEKKSVMDGFGLTKYSHSMHTSEYLIHVVLTKYSHSMHTSELGHRLLKNIILLIKFTHIILLLEHIIFSFMYSFNCIHDKN